MKSVEKETLLKISNKSNQTQFRLMIEKRCSLSQISIPLFVKKK